MSKPIEFPEQNFVFKRPAEMTEEQCGDLPVWKGEVPADDKGNKFPAIISCWKLTQEELEEVERTGEIWLSITGHGMPPVSVFGGSPFVKQ